MVCIAPDSCVIGVRRTAARVSGSTVLQRRRHGSAALLLILAAVLLSTPLAADPELPADLQTALTTAIAAAAGSGGTWVPPAGLYRFLAAHPEQAQAVARAAAPQFASRSEAIDSESPCGFAAGLARELGGAAPEQASEIQEILAAAAPECDIIVTKSMEECLTTIASGAGPGARMQQDLSRMQQDLLPAEAGRGGGDSGTCGGGCQTAEPGDPQIVRQIAF